MSQDELQRLAVTRTRNLLARAAEHYGISPPQVEIRFDLRGQSAGMASHGAASGLVIRYNPLLLRENGEDFLRRTVPHEVAHLITRLVFGLRCRPHGEEWREVMAFFGADPSRCHNYDTSRARTRTLTQYPYACGCRDHALSSIRHNRARRGQRYLCRSCGGVLKQKA